MKLSKGKRLKPVLFFQFHLFVGVDHYRKDESTGVFLGGNCLVNVTLLSVIGPRDTFKETEDGIFFTLFRE